MHEAAQEHRTGRRRSMWCESAHYPRGSLWTVSLPRPSQARNSGVILDSSHRLSYTDSASLLSLKSVSSISIVTTVWAMFCLHYSLQISTAGQLWNSALFVLLTAFLSSSFTTGGRLCHSLCFGPDEGRGVCLC